MPCISPYCQLCHSGSVQSCSGWELHSERQPLEVHLSVQPVYWNMIRSALRRSIDSSHILLVGAKAGAIIIVTRVTRKPERYPGLSIFESDDILSLGEIHTTQDPQVPRNLVLATLTSKLAYLASLGAS